jgi:hypothetical protein
MKIRMTSAALAFATLCAVSMGANAQGIVKGAQEGAAVGNKAAGPVGGAVGGAVGGVTGGVVGGVKGVLGIPQNTSSIQSTRATKSSLLSGSSIRSGLLGRPLQWTSSDGTQSGTMVFYTDGTAALMNANLTTGPDDKGMWTMRGNRLCVTWEKLRAGQENCSTWTRLGPKTFRDSDGFDVTTR